MELGAVALQRLPVGITTLAALGVLASGQSRLEPQARCGVGIAAKAGVSGAKPTLPPPRLARPSSTPDGMAWPSVGSMTS
jgi:hypothetical protein